MEPLKKRAAKILSQVELASDKLKMAEKRRQADGLEQELAVPEIWNNPTQAQAKSKQLAGLHKLINPWITLKAQAEDILELLETNDESLANEFDGQLTAMEQDLEAHLKELRFNGEYDDYDAIIRLSAGAGGTDAQDWTEMLERMYLRWAEKADMTASIVERSPGEEAGIKSSVIEVSGPYAYGKLKGEHGVHRLVRLSPFNSDNLRQTSFALVEILPQIDQPEQIELNDKDLKIDVYRAGGHGGQSVNTTDSAVRVTHLPTGITVAIQNERSQQQNRETALKILRGKLAQLQLEQHASSVAELQAGESAKWGAQIRNYVLHPYTLVKDTRTKHEDKNAQAVLDGAIGGFIDAFIDKV